MWCYQGDIKWVQRGQVIISNNFVLVIRKREN